MKRGGCRGGVRGQRKYKKKETTETKHRRKRKEGERTKEGRRRTCPSSELARCEDLMSDWYSLKASSLASVHCDSTTRSQALEIVGTPPLLIASTYEADKLTSL